jgi:copper chaperone CopZ
MKTATYTAPGIHCGGCVSSIQRSLQAVPGVDAVSADPATKVVEVRYDETRTGEEAIKERLTAAGFPPAED